MKLLVLSDNHGDETLMDEVYALYEDEIDVWLHCGDSEFNTLHPMWNIFQPVGGNMDETNAYELESVRRFNEHRIMIVHGHEHHVNQGFDVLVESAKQKEVRFVFYGHTHIPKVDVIDGICLVNPGSLTQPRGEMNIGSYVIAEIDSDTHARIDFYDTNHQKMHVLSQEINL